MASNRDSSMNKRASMLTRNDGRFPPGADRERASYIYAIRKTVSAIRAGDPCVKGDLAFLQAQYEALEDLHWKFGQAHGNLMTLLTDSMFETQEHELFDTICREATAALTILKRAMKTRERIENPIPKRVEAPAPSQTIEPKSELERLIAENAVLMHRLGMAKMKNPEPTPSTNQTVQPSTSKTAATHIRSPLSKSKPKPNQTGRISNGTDLRETITKKQLQSAVVLATTAKQSETDTTCAYCFASHKIFRCEDFKRQTLSGRLDAVARLRLCTVCLLFKANNHKCKKGHAECKLCAPLAHNSLLSK